MHEQSRPDRDNNVEVLLQNVESGQEDQFEIKKNVDVANTGFGTRSIYLKSLLQGTIWWASCTMLLPSVKMGSQQFRQDSYPKVKMWARPLKRDLWTCFGHSFCDVQVIQSNPRQKVEQITLANLSLRQRLIYESWTMHTAAGDIWIVLEKLSFPFFLSRQSEDTEESGTTEHPSYHYLSDYEDFEENPNAYNDYQTDNGTSGFPHVIDETGFLFSSHLISIWISINPKRWI